MISFIRSLLSAIKSYRKHIMIVFLFTLLIVGIRFPWSESTEKIVRNIKAKVQLPLHIDFKKVNLHLFPPSLSFHELQLDNNSFNEALHLDELTLSLALQKWLAFHPGYQFHLKKEKSNLLITFWTQKKKVDRTKKLYHYFDGTIPFMDLTHLKSLSKNIQAEGEAQLDFSLHFDKNNLSTLSGLVSAEGSKIKFQKFYITTPIGPLRLPNIKWKKIIIKLRFSDGQIIIDKFQLGVPEDSFYVQLRGYIAFSFFRRFKIEDYDIQTRIDVDQSFRLDVLDLMLANTKTQTQRGYRYQARIRGGKDESSNIERLSVF